MSKFNQRAWPRRRDDFSGRNAPNANFLTADGYLESRRELNGPLRHGTEPRTGPKGEAVTADRTRDTDFGTDRISPRGFDPEGTALSRYGQQQESPLIASRARRR